MAGGSSGSVNSRARSTVKKSPWAVTSSPVNSRAISRAASSSIDRRRAGDGQSPPTTCSLSASPVPSPSVNVPSHILAAVAAAWATIAGWYRWIGQVTWVMMGNDVAWHNAPMTVQANGDSPCSPIHGWKWSEIDR